MKTQVFHFYGGRGILSIGHYWHPHIYYTGFSPAVDSTNNLFPLNFLGDKWQPVCEANSLTTI
jgi:hypothetical protein